MDNERYEKALEDAARLWSIDPAYFDIWGQQHVTAAATQESILRAMGVDTASAESIERAIAARDRETWTRLAPPCLVIGDKAQPALIPLYVPEALAAQTASIEAHSED